MTCPIQSLLTKMLFRTTLLHTFLWGVNYAGLLIFRGKKSKILRDFQGQIRGKIGRFRGIFAGKKSKFAEQSAYFGQFSREKSQNSPKNWPISRDFSGKKSIFEGFSGAHGKFRWETSPRNNESKTADFAGFFLGKFR